MRCDYAYDSGAYVLGALSPTERASYERHLAGCATCREEVGEVAVLPGLLGRLDSAGIEQIASAPSSESRMPDLIDAVTRSRRRDRMRRRWRTAGSALAAACLALFVGLGAGMLRTTTPDTPDSGIELVAMRSVIQDAPVSAEIGLTTTKWGTEITMHCAYKASSVGKENTFRLYAYDADGTKEQIGSWDASPGADIKFTGMTSFSGDKLTKLTLARKDGTELLEFDVS
jgi:anti-sigma-K factor RskA